MTETATLDVRGLKCPMPIIQARKRMETLPAGSVLRIVATDPGSVLDFQGWMKSSSTYELLGQEEGVDDQGRRTFIHLLRRKS
jgi:TusA-related sulfurtransferase